VEQVLLNLLSNAAKYAAPESEIQVEAFARDIGVELAVTNVGEGLAPEEQARLFTRFYRAGTHRSEVEGLGLGLYIAKGLVEAHGGRIWVDSEPGKFAKFSFTLPYGARTGLGLAGSAGPRPAAPCGRPLEG
jgi:signal transduction histidine kinase